MADLPVKDPENNAHLDHVGVTLGDLRESATKARDQGASYEDARALMKSADQQRVIDSVYGKDLQETDRYDEIPPESLSAEVGAAPASEPVLEPLNEQPEVVIPESVASEEAFHTATLSGENDVNATYYQVKDEVQNTGRSDTSMTTRARIAKELNFIENEKLFEIVYNSPNMSPEEKSALVNAQMSKMVGGHEVRMQDELVASIGAAKEFTDTDKQRGHESVMAAILNEGDYTYHGIDQNSIDALVAQNVQLGEADSVGGMTALTVDLMATAIPFNVGRTYSRVVNELLPEKAKIYDWLLPGEALNTIKEHLNNLPIEEKREFTMDIMRAIDKYSGHLESNDFIKYMLLHSTLKEVNNPTAQDQFDWDRTIENASGILDLVFAGQILVKGGAKILRSLPTKSPAHTLNLVARNEAAKLVAEGILSPEAAKALGATQEELITAAIYPTAKGIPKQPMSPKIVSELNALQQKLTEAGRISEFPSINMFGSEIDDAMEAWRVALTEKDGATLYGNLTEIGLSESGEQLVAKAFYGQNAETGFASGVEAMMKGKQLFGNEPFQIYKNTSKGVVVAKSITSGKGEYFIGMEMRRNFNAGDATVFGPDSVHIGGAKAKYLGDPSARFSKEISDAGAVAHDVGKGISAKLHEMIKPLTKLRHQSKMKVMDTIQEGAKDAKTFTHDELIAKGFTEAEEIAYQGWRTANDALYMLNNRRYRSKLVNNNTQYMTGKGGGKYLVTEEIDETVKFALDPKTGKMVEIDAAFRTLMEADGTKFMKMHKPHMEGSKGTPYVIMRESDGSKLAPIPDQVLNYTPGYVTRYYKDMYFIDEERMIKLNGGSAEPVTRTVMTAGSPSEADQLVLEMNRTAGEGATGVVYKPRRGAEYSTDERANKLLQVEEARGRVFFSERGTALNSIEGVADVEDPIDSLLRAIGTTARAVSHDPFVNSMKQRWMNTYATGPQSLLEKGQKGFPDKFDKATGGVGQKKRVGEAKALHDYISLMAGQQDHVQMKWKALMMGWGEQISEWGYPRVGNFFTRRQRNPMAVAKGVTFKLFLGANPIRHLPLQTQQALFVAPLAPKYWATSASRHKLALDAGMALDIGKAGVAKSREAKLAARGAGMEPAEYIHMIRAFRDSGLPYSIDAHVFVSESVKTVSHDLVRNNAKRIGGQLLSIPGKALQLAQKVGFDYGEYNNLSVTWLTARHRHMKRTGKSWKELKARDNQTIAADARQMALSMTEAGSMGYQRGWAQLATQFISIQHKALAAMMPGFIPGANKAFTGAEKARMFAGQTIFYGANGLGINQLYKYARDKMGYQTDPEMDIAIQGGIADYTLNKVFESDQLSVSADFAPASGLQETGENILLGLIEGDFKWYEVVAGPSWQAGSRIWGAVDMLQSTMVAPDLTDPEKLSIAVNEVGRIASGYNNYLKARVAMTLGHHVSKAGDPIMQATFTEAMSVLGGFRTTAIKDFYDMKMNDQPGTMQGKTERSDAIEDIAVEYHRRIKMLVNTNMVDPAESLDELYRDRLTQAMKTEATILSYLEPHEKAKVILKFREILAQEMKVGDSSLLADITKRAIDGDYGADSTYFMNKLRNSRLIRTEEQMTQAQALYDYATRKEQ